ncbi:hypothetical protein AC579_711 [Pseudocercospora musae]|uniref:Arrestin-like N-terminal domain-containing protein n=1 Tax=Pseudocercospora musae TaxID=113226 RepID=A0A139GTN8_9PEZI|nr:hypothetical protein AC579_711 [Pseudocercospora musae]
MTMHNFFEKAKGFSPALNCTQFSLTIPWGTEDVHGGSPYVEEGSDPEAYTTRSHPLTPTFVHQHDSNRYASVEYGLQVHIHFADGTSEPYASAVKGFVYLRRTTVHQTLQSPDWSREVSNAQLQGQILIINAIEIDEEKILLNASPDIQNVQGEQRMAEKSSKLVFPATFQARIPSSVCPSFRTLNINRTYRLKMVLEADICGKNFEHKFELSVAVVTPAAR